MKTTVSSKGQIVLPAELRQMDFVEAGQEFDVERLDRGDYRLIRRAPRRNAVATRNRADFLNAAVRIVDPFLG